MSVLYSCIYGWTISHEDFIKNIYKNVQINNETKCFQLKPSLFNINSQFLRNNQNVNSNKFQNTVLNLKRKRKKITSNSNFDELINEVEFIQNTFNLFVNEPIFSDLFKTSNLECRDNKLAQSEAENCYNVIDKISLTNCHGSNSNNAIIQTINDAQYLFPKSSRFFCKNISAMNDLLNEQFDLILLDPPWWNKYIRRKNARSTQGYKMMYNLDLSVIPIDKILAPNGLVIVWCTNSPQHLKDLREEIFPKWGIRFLTKWFWLKVTCEGVPICNFSEPPGKQPFEQIIFGVRENNKEEYIPHNKLIISVPSALHSHKPPLTDLIKPYLDGEPRCLEVFARYLLPGWCSWGLEVLKLQHEYLYEEQN